MFASAMKLFENEGLRVAAIRGFWRPGQGSDNYRQYTENLEKGMAPKQAAANTWTGRSLPDLVTR
ncbi:hypothetical protein [Andreprevotia sp. IGB-42]|uniref:hypothetical protein n=1 Tax=Andreprevotia sp. IGB-42 TaxID=2497473 RepID=UPI001357A892|nr:hypothetical protein [Andreprevotia sp. IGB-42]